MQCTVAPFTSAALWNMVHKRAHYLEKAWRAGGATIRRLLCLATSRRYHVVYILREAFPFGPPLLELLLATSVGRMVFDFDDAIYTGHSEPSSLPNPFLYRLKYARQTWRVIRRADRVIAGNRILADYARKYNDGVEIIPTAVDTNRFSYHEPAANRAPMVLGWMGSTSTSPYLGLLKNVFRELKSRFKERIRFAIYGDPGCEAPIEGMDIRPFRLETEIADLRSIDIGLMPLPENDWTRGKCAFKAIQYMALGIPAACSPVGVVNDLILDGENGLLCRTEAEWIEKLSLLIDSLQLRRSLAARARRKIEAEYSVNTWAPKLAEILEAVALGLPANHNQRLEIVGHPGGR